MNKKILIIEDDEGIIDVLSTILESEHYKVLVSKTTDGVIKKIKDELPNIILLDLWVPGEEGKDLPKKIKSNSFFSKIPILVVSANHDIQKITKSLGADGYISKPFDIDVLLKTIKKYLK